ncbi:GT2 family glycosyltransferase [Gillisia sp. Hel_I_86]|uniref:glycosyltransferase family 2 protein n=1 Tax=Gillisia sp. Hel_I_86 TaxID=1249981 RepID=UPI0011993955|nr:glycosyltransferase family 2 protein [Gillisia sp. Hel_I_86]TVZ25564.1 GT2 family glycosyltransferase [Gillisia sp. Hel_I_86]
MRFSLIICTYCRAHSLYRLLESIKKQTLYPDEILIVDGSPDSQTEQMLNDHVYASLRYYKVDKYHRGLTKQRNLGVKKSHQDSEILCFLDDDIVLKPDYFKHLVSTFSIHPGAVGVGGAIINARVWKKSIPGSPKMFKAYYYKEWERKLGSRNVLRKRLGLLSDRPPGIMPVFSNGFSIGYYPPLGEIHQVEFFMGGVSAYRKELFSQINFSEYFQGYGLYEDMDFCLRASKIGLLYLNTAAQVYHLHEAGGRPNHFKYGQMVIRNGFYVWRVKYPKPTILARFQWHSIALLLTLVRLGNVVTTSQKKEALTESLGRIAGWWSLFFKEPGTND